MKEKLILALKTKYSNLGFTDKAFEGVANFLVATVTEDSQIETAVSGVDPLLKSFQGDVDHRVNTAVKKATEGMVPKPDGVEPTKTDPVIPANETPTDKLLRETLEALKESNKQNGLLAERVAKIEGGAATVTRQSTLDVAIKDAPAAYKEIIMKNFKYVKDANQETFDSFLQETVDGLPAFTKSFNEDGLGRMPKPTISAKAETGGKTSSFIEQMKAVTEDTLAKKESGK